MYDALILPAILPVSGRMTVVRFKELVWER